MVKKLLYSRTGHISLAVLGNNELDSSSLKGLPSQYKLHNYIDGESQNSKIDIVLLKANRVNKSLLRQTELNFPNAVTAFYDLTINDSLESYLLYPSVRGFFQRDESSELMAKGLKHLKQGEYWLPREVMGKVLDSAKNQRSHISQIENSLSKREVEVVQLVSNGEKNDDIALHLNISFHTVKTHLTHIYKKLGIKSRAELISLLGRTEQQLF